MLGAGLVLQGVDGTLGSATVLSDANRSYTVQHMWASMLIQQAVRKIL